ncbi:hypothetical protein GGGNBK_10730 [Sporosarcina sp. ANT_H38]
MKRNKHERIMIINKLIEKIAENGREFLFSKKHKRFAYFV